MRGTSCDEVSVRMAGGGMLVAVVVAALVAGLGQGSLGTEDTGSNQGLIRGGEHTVS